MASLKRIASDLGVSYTLVSKVLNDRLGTTGVSPKMREAILSKAKELEYIPNRLAVALKAGRRGAVGIFLHHFGESGSEVTDRLLRGCAEGLERSGYRMWLRFFKTDEEFLAACDDQLKREVDGLIVGGVQHESLIAKLHEMEQNLPIVSVFCDSSDRTRSMLHNVGADYELQGFRATTHLLDQGCRMIATFPVVENRHKGYVRALSERNVKLNPKLIVNARDFRLSTGTVCAKELIGRDIPFDGIVCQSDSQAVGVINELVHRGFQVPGAVKVIGVDDSPLAEACIVPITSITSGMTEAGQKAVELLLKKIAGEKVESVLIQSEVVERSSSRV